MHKLQQRTNVWSGPTGAGLGVMICATILWLNPSLARADITNVIWRAQLSGQLVIQTHDAKLEPRKSMAHFTTKSLISMLGGSSQVLGLNVVMAGGQTNFFLSLYNLTSRQNTSRITSNEITTMVSDGKNLTFTVEAPMVKSGSTWGGGFLRVAGTGHMVKGVPAGLHGAVEGIFIDTRPGDLNGTTGLVVQARITTSNVPLRVLPQD